MKNNNARRRAAYAYSEADYWRRNRLNERYRDAAFALLGTCCKRCGIQDRRVLQFDHLHGGGSQHRKAVHHYRTLKYVIEHPEEFQVLCANCNVIKRYENREGVGFKSFKPEAPQIVDPQMDLMLPRKGELEREI